MKVFEVKINKTRTENECKFEWPGWWGEVYEQVDVVAYEDHPESHGKKTEGAVCVCDDETWAVIDGKNDPLVSELSENEANEKGCAWRPQVEKKEGKSRLFDVRNIALDRGDVLRGA